jgi:hypothetical protein
MRQQAIGAMTLGLLLYSSPVRGGLICYGYEYAPNLVRSVQTRLKSERCYRGTVDGKWGPETKRAVGCFQHKKELRTSEELDEPTLKAMFGEDAPKEAVTVIPNPHHMPEDLFRRNCLR